MEEVHCNVVVFGAGEVLECQGYLRQSGMLECQEYLCPGEYAEMSGTFSELLSTRAVSHEIGWTVLYK